MPCSASVMALNKKCSRMQHNHVASTFTVPLPVGMAATVYPGGSSVGTVLLLILLASQI